MEVIGPVEFEKAGAVSGDLATVVSLINVEVIDSPAEENTEFKVPTVIFAILVVAQEKKTKTPTKSNRKEKVTTVSPKKKKLIPLTNGEFVRLLASNFWDE